VTRTTKLLALGAVALFAVLAITGTRDADRRHRECTGPHKSWDSAEDDCVVEVGFGGMR